MKSNFGTKKLIKNYYNEQLKQELTNKLIDSVLETPTVFWDNPNGGHVYTCPFCSDNKEVKATEYISMNDLNHSDNCIYLLAQQLSNL